MFLLPNAMHQAQLYHSKSITVFLITNLKDTAILCFLDGGGGMKAERGLRDLLQSSQKDAEPEYKLCCFTLCVLSPCGTQPTSDKSRTALLQILRKEGFMVFLPNSEFLLPRIMKTLLLRRLVLGLWGRKGSPEVEVFAIEFKGNYTFWKTSKLRKPSYTFQET